MEQYKYIVSKNYESLSNNFQKCYEASRDTSHRLDHFTQARGEQLYKFGKKEFNPHGILGVHQYSSRFVRHFRKEVTGNVAVSYWPIFSLSSVTVPEVFANVNSSQFSSRFQTGELILNSNIATVVLSCENDL